MKCKICGQSMLKKDLEEHIIIEHINEIQHDLSNLDLDLKEAVTYYNKIKI